MCLFLYSLLHQKSVDSIQTTLCDARLWYNDKDNRIFMKQKNDIHSEDQLFGAIEEWLKAMSSAYVLDEDMIGTPRDICLAERRRVVEGERYFV